MPFLAAIPAAVTAAGISGGAGIASSLLNRRGARTSTNNSTSTNQTILTPQQRALSDKLTAQLSGNLDNPNSSTAGILARRNRNKTKLTKRAATASKTLESRLASRGFERSGSLQEGFEGIEGARIEGLTDLDIGAMEQIDAAQRADKQIAVENALRFLPTEVTQRGTGTGTGTAPGSALGSGVNAGLESITTLLTLQKILGGGGLFGGGGGGGDDPGVTNLDQYFAGLEG